jgi:hypothetical protein
MVSFIRPPRVRPTKSAAKLPKKCLVADCNAEFSSTRSVIGHMNAFHGGVSAREDKESKDFYLILKVPGTGKSDHDHKLAISVLRHVRHHILPTIEFFVTKFDPTPIIGTGVLEDDLPDDGEMWHALDWRNMCVCGEHRDNHRLNQAGELLCPHTPTVQFFKPAVNADPEEGDKTRTVAPYAKLASSLVKHEATD